MAIALASAPDKWDSAGRPLEVVFTSSLNPNIGPDGSIPIFEIRNPNAFELANVASLDATDVIITGNFGNANFVVGDWVSIESTALALYSGEYRVIGVPNTDILVIEAAYLGDDVQGILGRVYKNYVIRTAVQASNDPLNPTYYSIQKGTDNRYTLDVSDTMRRTFGSIFTEVFPSAGYDGIGSGLRSVVQSYLVTASEAYDVPTDGIPVLLDNPPLIKYVSNKFAINSAHPYNETDANGNTVFSWEDNYTGFNGYIISAAGNQTKFLTYSPRTGQCVAPGEDFFLVYLWDGDRNGGLELTFSQYTAAGTFISNTDLPITPPTLPGAYLLNVGLSQLSNYINANAAYYIVALQNSNEGLFTEQFRLNICSDCGPASTRMFWRNGLGGIDQYTFTARQDEGATVTTRTMTKPSMARTINYVDWTERAYKTDISRTFTVWSRSTTQEIARWLGRELLESADIVINGYPGTWQRIILETESLSYFSTKASGTRVSLAYRIGADNSKQQQ